MFEALPITYLWYAIGALLALCIVLLAVVARLKGRLKVFFTNVKGEEWETSLKSQIAQLKRVAYRVKDTEEKIKALETIAQKSTQKIGIVRYNPFNETAGNQSFSLAVLDNADNGIVLSTLFTSERSRVYVKPVKNGSSSMTLTDEEKKAITEAQKAKVPKLVSP